LVAIAVLAAPGNLAATECTNYWDEHPEWVFCHDFEEPDSDDFDQYWDDVYGAPDRVFLIDESPPGIGGEHAMRTQAINDGDEELSSGTSSGPKKFFGATVDWDALYYRKYVRFNEEFAQGNFMHLGGLSACAEEDYPWECMGHAGERPAGDDRFSSNLEPWSDYQSQPFPGRWGFYSYYHEMYMDCGHPTEDDCWGDMFAPDEDHLISRGDWHVLEMMIQPNTPGATDGYQTFWADGEKVYTSPMINWRTTDALRINKAGVYLYVHNVPAHTSCIFDVDNVVFSTSYIGPAPCLDEVELSAPCLCGGDPDPEDGTHVHSSGYCCDGTWNDQPCGSGDDDDASDDDAADDDDDDDGDGDGGAGGCSCQAAAGPSVWLPGIGALVFALSMLRFRRFIGSPDPHSST